jgi:NitT/TauT family transport system ATP-binding protein
MTQPAIEIVGAAHRFGRGADAVQALAPTFLTINRGELMCLIGPSGCGKSTLLNMMGGLLIPNEGTVLVNGTKVTGPRPAEIGFVFQESALFPWNTVQENIELGLLFRGSKKALRRDQARAALDTVGLLDFANHYPSQLSGGMRQRAALARVLSLDTDIILMDEPFGALDEQTRMILGEDLSVLLSRTGKTIVFVTHSLGEAVFLADRVAVFSVRPGTIKQVLDIGQPHPRTPAFVTSPEFTDMRNELYTLLHDEIRKSVGGVRAASAGADGGRAAAVRNP